MIFRHRFVVRAPLAAVEAFHRRPESLAALTPPPLLLRFSGPPPAELAAGDELAFTLWAGPLPVAWRARIEALDAAGGASAPPAAGEPGSSAIGDPGPAGRGGLRSQGEGEPDPAPPAAGFADRQLQGPFAHWRHHHRFRALDPHSTEIEDWIEARLRRHPLWGPVGLAMWLGLPPLFAYRGWKTRRLLLPGLREAP